MKNNPLVSVIISCKNEAEVIATLLTSLKNQTYHNSEIIVVDNKSTDATKAIAKKFTKNVFDFGPERSEQRNYGVKKAKGDFVLILDADMELTKNVIAEAVEKMENDKKLGGIIIPEISIGKRFWEKAKAFERSFYFEKGGNEIEAARFFRKSAFLQTKGYDGDITGTEDWDLSQTIKKSGWKIIRLTSPLYHHETIPSLRSLAEKYYYYGLTAHKTLAKQKTATISPKTIPFLRPVFYQKFYRFIAHPFLGLGMFILLITQLGASGLGFLIGKNRNT